MALCFFEPSCLCGCKMVKQKTLVVIGGGAAGFFCAVNAARMNSALHVILVEKTGKLLSKVKVSGGGRCNVTHACFEIEELIKRYPRGKIFLKKAFHQFHPKNTIEWFEERGVGLKTESDGRMFPETNTSQTIIDCLLREANQYGVEVLMNRAVSEIENRKSKSENERAFKIHFTDSQFIESDYLFLGCGGFPKALQYGWINQLGHSIEEPVPSLFTFNLLGNTITQLMGISVENVIVKIAGSKLLEDGPLLITHWGLSGPAILKLSAWGAKELAEKKYEFTAIVNWIHENENQLRNRWTMIRQQMGNQKMNSKNPFGLPNRLWLYFLQLCGINNEVRWSELSSRFQNSLITNLTAQAFNVKGKTTFKEEFVTAGGIKLSEIDPNTMQSKIIEGLFFGGEIMDVDGVTGGFNFQHAWTSGWIAANAIARSYSHE
ncbi:MAG: NAD(P)/FAD-dependent oxidoreductase [Chitinophagaceae bacterium]|nr:NAD(P)/FAD-dependent oxidoreductase [Chitinophagaceae bacterium]